MKPNKPYPKFPLFPHATKRWAKKIRGKTHYFGPWRDPQGALALYLAQKDDLHAGRRPSSGEGATVRDALNAFLAAKDGLVQGGEMTPRVFKDYRLMCGRVAAAFGLTRSVSDLRGEDFTRLRETLSRTWGPYTLAVEIQRVRTLFKFAFESGLIETPVRLSTFRPPSKTVIRRARMAKPPRMFEAEEVRAILDAARPVLRTMVLLGLNCGFGNSDVAKLPAAAISGEWVNFPRPKTGIIRRIPLWPETIEAVECVAGTPLVFRCNPEGVGETFVRTAKRAGILGRGFYALRHTTETIGGEAKDQVAVDAIMGHARYDMASVYRERVSDDRLRGVTEHIRGWLCKGVSVLSIRCAPQK